MTEYGFCGYQKWAPHIVYFARSYYRKENAADVLTNQELLFHVSIVSVTRKNFRLFGLSSKFLLRWQYIRDLKHERWTELTDAVQESFTEDNKNLDTLDGMEIASNEKITINQLVIQLSPTIGTFWPVSLNSDLVVYKSS